MIVIIHQNNNFRSTVGLKIKTGYFKLSQLEMNKAYVFRMDVLNFYSLIFDFFSDFSHLYC